MTPPNVGTRPRYGAPAFLLLLAGCGDPLKQAQRLEEPRILGVRVSGTADEAALQPGRPASFDVLLAGPKGPLAARFEYQLCQAADSNRGVPFCAESPFASGTAALGSAVAFDVPESVGAARRLALLGVACSEGEPALADEPLAWTCSGSAEPLRVSFDAQTATANVVNQNPDLSTLRVAIDGTDVPLADVNAAPSCAEGTPEVATGRIHTVELSLGNAAREPVRPNAAPRETLQLSHFSTRGVFERQFSFIDPAAKAATTDIEWEAPSKPGPVKQYLVVRDERGGVSWVSANLCAR